MALMQLPHAPGFLVAFVVGHDFHVTKFRVHETITLSFSGCIFPQNIVSDVLICPVLLGAVLIKLLSEPTSAGVITAAHIVGVQSVSMWKRLQMMSTISL